MDFEWKGVFPALNTYFTPDEELDLEMLGKNLNAQSQAGVNGFILGGSLGEASVLRTDEKERLVKFCIDKLKGELPVVLNIAEGSTRQAVQQAQYARDWGANGLMLLPPMRYSSDHREAVTFFKAVAEVTSLPIMIYNNPVDYKTEVTLGMFEELQPCPTIQAVKESTRDLANVTRMINRFGDRFKILCGVDTIALDELLMGADGWVAGLSDAFPAETVAVYRLAKAGRIEEARKIFRWFLPLLELDIHPKLVQYIKLAATLAGLGSEFVRPPRLALVGKERERVTKIIQDGIACKPVLPDYLNL